MTVEENIKKIAEFEDKSLLIVDDDNPFRERLARSMEKKGFEVIQAEGVKKGIDKATQNKPYFAVVDLRLNDGNGIEVVKHIQKLNPNSTIPVLDDNGFILYESNSIIKYISEKYDFLKTNDTQLNAITNQWIDWSSLVFGLPCSILTAHSLVLPVEKRNLIMAKESQQKIHSIFEILDNQLLKNNFILGKKFSLADIPIGCWLHRCRVLKIDISSFKGINNWALKLDSRKAFQEAVVSAPLPPN